MQQSGNQPDTESFLCAFLRGENPPWIFGQEALSVAAILERAEYHGVLALMHERLQRNPESGQGWPPDILHACRESALAHGMWELRHRVLLKDVFARLAAEGVVPVVFKGTALAYNLYPEGVLRSRGDTDLIVAHGTQSKTFGILAGLGFKREHGISGESVAYEASFTREEPGGGSHTLDVHWRINNSELLSKLFTYDELLAQSQPIPKLGPDARAAGPVHALLIACMHRATHKQNPYYVNGVAYYSGDRLIWLYDIHLLASTFATEQWEAFLRMAEQKGLRSVCLEGLERARASFHTTIPESAQSALDSAGAAELAGRYLESGILRQQWMNFCAIPGIMRKLRFLVQTVFPPPEYMRQKYPQGGWLPWLYLRRSMSGVLKRLRSTLPAL